MEFPELGKHCYVTSCKQLDFLPVRCDACRNTFCKEHFTYDAHSCSESYKKDNQVPVCPLCNIPIPLMKGELADVKVGRHIDTDCQSDPAKEKRKVYKNKCSVKGCKQKELIPVNCDRCHKNYCLKHRHETDHKCTGFQGSGRGITHAGASAVQRTQQPSNTFTGPFRPNKPQQTSMSNIGRNLDRERRQRQSQPVSSYQAGMSEDEAMAQALAMSMQDAQPNTSQQQPNSTTSQEDEDLALARALQQSEEEAARQRQQQRPGSIQRQTSVKDKCAVS